ncbi:uncharacterized protein BO87DRAFT_399589 [Aspergillus neoniger CBS 115656]|uniref:Uncharacterized protein n=1 Tax=Aspergillus neoniger (strain CBS 115656) TaxID=1448310 RepID=A0A318YG48_ASPNB|nr:hypothetical protein BO87DRAFT_399589 [Aspergillus neoniger CBS 115656]PYH31463.1 hypothetical protein BO87DRAFT_399589 [Aspergillus neoniger CBS 115656]
MGEGAAAAAASAIKSAWTGRVVVGAGLGKMAAGFAEGSHGWRSDTVQVAVIGGGFHDLDDHPDKQNMYIDAELRSGERVRPTRQQVHPNRPSGQAPTISLNLLIFKTTGYCTFPLD